MEKHLTITTNASVGVLMLNTRFPRLPGDIGNPDSFNYPVIYKIIDNARPANVITEKAIAQNLQADFYQAAQALAEQNVAVITTSCGFLSPLQSQLAKQSTVPVLTSALTLLPLLSAIHGGLEYLGIITFDRHALSTRHFGQHAPAAVSGLQERDTLRQTIAHDLPELNHDRAEQEVLRCVTELNSQTTALRAIVLECTNLSPYKQALRKHTGLPVYDIIDAVHWLIQARH